MNKHSLSGVNCLLDSCLRSNDERGAIYDVTYNSVPALLLSAFPVFKKRRQVRFALTGKNLFQLIACLLATLLGLAPANEQVAQVNQVGVQHVRFTIICGFASISPAR